MTDRFDPKNSEHVAIKKGIELGDGIEAQRAALIQLYLPGVGGNRRSSRSLAEEWLSDFGTWPLRGVGGHCMSKVLLFINSTAEVTWWTWLRSLLV